mmetsp:Transcript_13954/g.16842  ORF Transcript_13954/g.16842 Transcript_13954/m.16842 type:complete len:295 (+) Transcript_13954:99-983(+)|eukprot:CAMPEP_0197848314 /NCGR_PEP_ID=MMETSP1438-20131217/8252_1 /TAXON_ID=1461541 /ORGANISM="Pterosperma sp., Strain CCMP1384" /LENGTH=294 /DNA_ID=CAMNT_0043460487 /DNA_START=92 /DNA_END=976 /DNA_ORIENTATION=-
MSEFPTHHLSEHYKTIVILKVAEHVLECRLNTPKNMNAMTPLFWGEIGDFFSRIADDGETRAVVLTAAGKLFTAGLDLKEGAGTLQATYEDVGRQALALRRHVISWQDAFTAIEKCGKPVIICVHGPCIGAGLEMASACDIRLCSADAYWAMKEVDIGLAADVGGLQRFPKVVGNQSIVRELALTGRKLLANEALSLGFVSAVLPDVAAMRSRGLEIACTIASKSPIATLGTKHLLNYTRDHTVDEALDYTITWNQAMLQSTDIGISVGAFLSKQKPTFDNLPSAPPSKLKAKL